jgi:hypothetical protein
MANSAEGSDLSASIQGLGSDISALALPLDNIEA